MSRARAASCLAILAVVMLPSLWAAGSEAHAAARDDEPMGRGVLAQAGDPGVDEDRPLPAQRDDAIGDEATSIGWLVATIGSIALLTLIAGIWLRLGRVTQRPAGATADPGEPDR